MNISIPQKNARMKILRRLSESFVSHIALAFSPMPEILVQRTRRPVAAVPMKFPTQIMRRSIIYAGLFSTAYQTFPVKRLSPNVSITKRPVPKSAAPIYLLSQERHTTPPMPIAKPVIIALKRMSKYRFIKSPLK